MCVGGGGIDMGTPWLAMFCSSICQALCFPNPLPPDGVRRELHARDPVRRRNVLRFHHRPINRRHERPSIIIVWVLSTDQATETAGREGERGRQREANRERERGREGGREGGEYPLLPGAKGVGLLL